MIELYKLHLKVIIFEGYDHINETYIYHLHRNCELVSHMNVHLLGLM